MPPNGQKSRPTRDCLTRGHQIQEGLHWKGMEMGYELTDETGEDSLFFGLQTGHYLCNYLITKD